MDRIEEGKAGYTSPFPYVEKLQSKMDEIMIPLKYFKMPTMLISYIEEDDKKRDVLLGKKNKKDTEES